MTTTPVPAAERPRFRVEKDELNRHYTYLIATNDAARDYVEGNFQQVWFDGMPTPGIIALYNGKQMANARKFIKPRGHAKKTS